MNTFYKYLKLINHINKINNNFNKHGNFFSPYKYNFDLTYECNSRCLTCNIWDIYKSNSDLKKSELQYFEYDKIFKLINESIYFVSFEGGEPFLKNDLSKIVQSLFNNCQNLIYLLIASNGSLPDVIENTIIDIQKYNNNKIPLILSLSFDGPEKIHNKIRGFENAFTLLNDTFNRMKKFKNIRVIFQTTICQSNWKYLLDFHDKINNEIIYTLAHSSHFFQNLNSSKEDIFKINEKKEFIDFLYNLSKKIKITSITSLLNKLYLKLSIQYFKNGYSPLPCFASFATLNIDPYGNLSKCAFSDEKILNFKDINYNTKDYLNKCLFYLDFNKNIKCNKCWMNCDALPTILHNILLGRIRHSFCI